MEDYFQRTDVRPDVVQAIRQCISATRLPYHPVTFLDEVICDADTYNLGTNKFSHTDALLKREYELKGFPTDNWDENTLKLLQQHHYFTSYCQQLLQKKKNENIEMVQKRLRLK